MTSTSRGFTPLALIAVGAILIAALTITPLAGWPGVTRLPAILIPALAMTALLVRPWRWDESQLETLDAWEPSVRVVWLTALLVGLVLFWFVLTRFRSCEINAVDFTVYFDRPSFQTWRGHPLFVETADDPGRALRSLLSVHAYWALFPLAFLYAVRATPLWLLAVSVVAVVAGAVHVRRIVQRLGGGGMMACASALAFVLNDNTARTLNYGFHPEVLYAWFVPWLLDAGLKGDRRSFLAAALACVLVKEDAFMLLFAASVALTLHRFTRMTWSDRTVFLVIPPLVAFVNFELYSAWIVPRLNADGALIYANYWANYGPTPTSALLGMLRHPQRVVFATLTSGFFRRVILPHLLLPLLGWRWMLGLIPIVMLYGASANEQLRAFGIYYSIVLVPFMVIGAASGAVRIADWLAPRKPGGRLIAAIVILLGALLAGGTNAGYSLRPWRPELRSVPGVLAQLAGEPVVLVQSGLYPHTGYDARIQLLTPEALIAPQNAGAVLVLAPAIGAYPFSTSDLETLNRLPLVRPPDDGLLVVRLPKAPRP